jgi:hypothetical protein
MAKVMFPWMRPSTGLRWNKPRRWPRKTPSTTPCSDLSVRGSHRRNPGGPRKTSLTVMTALKKLSISGLPQRDIVTICCSTMHPASASRVPETPALVVPIGRWRSRAIISRRQRPQASEPRHPQKENLLRKLAAPNSLVSAFNRSRVRRAEQSSMSANLQNVKEQPQTICCSGTKRLCKSTMRTWRNW